MRQRHKQKGFTLVEMMISSAIGLIVMAGVISIFATSVAASGDNMKRVRLNQEIRTIMDVMVRDIRRAGYWRDANSLATANPFATLFVSADSQCLSYSYDVNQATPALPLGNEDNFGFRLINGAVRYRTSSTNCDTNAGWNLISDPNVVNITTLTFNLQTVCTNLSNPTGAINCTSAGGTDTLASMQRINITLTGQLKNDANVRFTLTNSVYIRNALPT